MRFNIFCFFLFFAIYQTKAQDVAIGTWRVHLPYNDAIAVTEAGSKIYCASNNGLFYYDKDENEVVRLSKVTGLSDIGVSTIKYNSFVNILVIAYSNTNIDLIEGDRVINISDIKRKSIPGNKVINDIFFKDNLAYLACGFGIVVMDLSKKEIKDTYYIGEGGSYIEVFDIDIRENSLFAATKDGVLEASLSDPNLANYTAWSDHTALPDGGNYNTMCNFNNKIYVNFSTGECCQGDTLYVYDGISWEKAVLQTYSNEMVNDIGTHNNQFVVCNYFAVDIFDIAGIRVHRAADGGVQSPNEAIIDKDNYIWIADNNSGLIKNWNSWMYSLISPNGPKYSSVVDMKIDQSALYVASGGRTSSWGNLYNKQGFYSFIDGYWNTYDNAKIPELDTIWDITSLAIDPSNRTHIYAGSWGRGMAEFDNGSLVNVYDETNSSLKSISSYYWVGVGGLAYDGGNNLWVTNSGVTDALSVKKQDGSWQSFNFSGYVSGGEIGNLIIDDFGQKWIILPRGGGLMVFNDNNTISTTSDDQIKKLNNTEGQGALPSMEVVCFAKDLEGEIWVGTDAGVGVFYTPDAVFTNGNFDAQRIFIEQDGHTQYLLETETVTAIAIDGANKKWIGTKNGGVFLTSADGTQQILNFNEDNSPLLSNSILGIAIDHETGEVFFGTEKGIISYKGTATLGGEEFENVYVYPNPVTSDYTGSIAVKGLVTNSNVKITDIAGNLIYETIAEGGQAIWTGKNFKGDKARTGVYLVFCSNDDGSKTYVTKLLFIN